MNLMKYVATRADERGRKPVLITGALRLSKGGPENLIFSCLEPGPNTALGSPGCYRHVLKAVTDSMESKACLPRLMFH